MAVSYPSRALLLLVLIALLFHCLSSQKVVHFHPSMPAAQRMVEKVLNESAATSRTLWTGPQGGASAFHAGVERVEVGALIPEHVHDVEEMLVVISGTAQLVEHQTVTHALVPMSVVVLPDGRRHEIRNSGNEPLWLFWAFPNSESLFAFQQEYGKTEL